MLANISKAFVATLMLLSASPVLAAVTPAQVVVNIKAVTVKSQALQAPSSSITLINGPLVLVGLGPIPQILAGFQDIVVTVTGALTAMQGSAQVTDATQAKAIADAFREFVRVHQVLLNILIGKAGLFNTVPIIGQPVAATLRNVEAIVDAVANAIIDMVQLEATSLTADSNSLMSTLETAIKAFSGILINQ